MKMLFLGGVFSQEQEPEIIEKSKGGVQYAANQFQWTLIDGLLKIPKLDIKILSAPFIGSFPKEYNSLFINGYHHVYKEKITGDYVPFVNLWGYRNISRKRNLIKQLTQFISDKANQKVILVYSPHSPFLQAAVYAKQKDPSVHICLMVPDLPQYMNLREKKSLVYTQTKKLDIKIFESNLEHVDSFILITKYMKVPLRVKEKPCIVVEGAVNIQNNNIELLSNIKSSNSEERVFAYTGTLNKKFGILNLLEAFHQLEQSSVVLKICGRGDAAEIVSEYAKKDKRIKFLGQVTNEEAKSIQKSATVLINPRPNNEEFTKYSFPFKTMEYLLSGVPLIAYKLDGIPDEYDEYIYYVQNDSIEALKAKMNEVINLSDEQRLEWGQSAREFILHNKNAEKIAGDIYNMLDNITKK
ncbi:glycosyltransferase [Paenibacillus sp. sgz500992]|uniref:glycosyltransferase n=1 Tax=Paenibacillus sp. sgz500992 TaxID=3242476 RepID=UPI0036D293D0